MLKLKMANLSNSSQTNSKLIAAFLFLLQVNDDFVKITKNFGSSLGEYGRAVMTLAVDAEPNYIFLILTMKVLALEIFQTKSYSNYVPKK